MRQEGFSLIETMVALMVTLIIMGAVFGLFYKGQTVFQREPEISDMQQSIRVGLDMINRDLQMAGYQTPHHMAVGWVNGAKTDQLTIIYADPEVPVSVPHCTGNNTKREKGGKPTGAGCGTVMFSSVVNVDPETFTPPQADPASAYHEGQVLTALETWDCSGPGGEPDGMLGVTPFEVTEVRMTNEGGKDSLMIVHNPGSGNTDLNLPKGFNEEVNPECAIIGSFHVVQYRVNPDPTYPHPSLERRDIGIRQADWIPVSNNIENLQVRFATGRNDQFVDDPIRPTYFDETTWITGVEYSISGRSESRDLLGSSLSELNPSAHIRKTFTTFSALRNQVAGVSNKVNAVVFEDN